MWNKGFHLIWFKFETGQNRRFKLPLPIPLYIIEELMECTLDLLTVICLFAPSAQSIRSCFSIHNVKELVQMSIKLFGSLTGEEPYDLVDITADKIKVSIEIH